VNINLPFITWRELPPLHAGAKPRKVPTDPRTGDSCDPHHQSGWLTAEQCHAAILSRPELSLRPGQVLSDADPYFMLDLDDCHDGTDWTEGAKRIVASFPGASVEVSINGRGLHVIARCDPAALGERRNKFDYLGVSCEFYHTGRFIALGHGFTGDPDIDFTATLAAIVPVREIHETQSLIDVADPEWSGPEDDDTLINLMLASRGSLATMFGQKASVADLWNGNVEALAVTFPSVSGDAFDRSSADGALMSHLAFWTGKNTDRMDRLFRRSALMRDKYERRSEYRSTTISGAVGITRNVYKQRGVAVTGSGPLAEPGKKRAFGEIMTPEEQQIYFDGCIYVTQNHAVLTPDGRLLKPAQFDANYGRHIFLMSSDGTKPTTNAFEALTKNRVHEFDKTNRTRFKPALPFQAHVEPDGVNCYFPPNIDTTPGDVSRMLNLLRLILPNDRDREIFLSWMAAVVQYPGVKFLWSPVLQGVEGNGKSIWGDVLYYCIGEDYAWTVEAKKIEASFNSFLKDRIFINVEEMNVFAKFELMDTLKGLITGKRQAIELKGVDQTMNPDYCANWFFATNHKDAVTKTKNDRRFAVFFAAQQSRADLVRDGLLDDAFFPKLYRWLRSEGGFAAMRHYLLNYKISEEFNPNPDVGLAIHAPETSSSAEAIAQSYGVAEQHILEAIESGMAGFRGGWLSTARVSEILHAAGIKKSPVKIAATIETMGYEPRGRATRMIMHEGNAKPRLYALAGVSGGLDEYEVAQGYR
jgi:hypothetical protein